MRFAGKNSFLQVRSAHVLILSALSHLTQQVPGVHSGLWWYAKYPLHVTESPSHATKEKGERMIEARVLDLADRLRAIKEDKVLPSLQQEFYERVRRVPEGD